MATYRELRRRVVKQWERLGAEKRYRKAEHVWYAFLSWAIRVGLLE